MHRRSGVLPGEPTSGRFSGGHKPIFRRLQTYQPQTPRPKSGVAPKGLGTRSLFPTSTGKILARRVAGCVSGWGRNGAVWPGRAAAVGRLRRKDPPPQSKLSGRSSATAAADHGAPAGASYLLADLGFGRTELARLCQELGFHYVIRIAAGVWIRHGKFEGRLSQYPAGPGMRRLLRGVQYRKVRSLVQNIGVAWRKDKQEPWFLMTGLNQGANQLCNLYGKRMQLEELFRDYKNRRNGFSLRDTRIRSPENLSRARLSGLGLHSAVGNWAPCQGARRSFQLGQLDPGGRLQLLHHRAADAGSDPTPNNDDASGRLSGHPGGR